MESLLAAAVGGVGGTTRPGQVEMAQAVAMEADYLATGHYARIDGSEGGRRLLRSLDETKDQSFVLYMLGQQELGRLLFPIGGYRKSEIRRLAQEGKLPHHRLNGSRRSELYFDLDEIDAAIRGANGKAAEHPSPEELADQIASEIMSRA